MTIILAAVVLLPCMSRAGSADRSELGARLGISDGRNDEDLWQYEGFGRYKLPWSYKFGSDWQVGSYLEGNAGALTGGGSSALIASAGPGIFLRCPGGLFALWMGINPTFISGHAFGDENFGGAFQFTSHVGLYFYFSRHCSIGYRLQHMSNAGIYDANPGVNMHMAGISFAF